MKWLEHIEEFFLSIAQVGEALLEAIAIICILLGIVVTAQLTLKLLKRRHRTEFPFIQVRIKFGTWLALALEFQLGADILNTTIAPNDRALINLAVIAVIRTFLNYFLNKEMEAQLDLQQKVKVHNSKDLIVNNNPIDNEANGETS